MKSNIIAGVIPVSYIEYPRKISTIVFLQGCNLCCNYCHNKDLIPIKPCTITDKEAVDAIKANLLTDGIVITGGEPTIHKQRLIDLIMKLKVTGKSVKIDTNASCNSKLFNQILDLVDSIAIDMKAPFYKYDIVTNTNTGIKVPRNIVTAIKSGKEVHLRTTVHPDILTFEDIKHIYNDIAITLDLAGKRPATYTIKTYRETKDVLHPEMIDSNKKYTDSEIIMITELFEKSGFADKIYINL